MSTSYTSTIVVGIDAEEYMAKFGLNSDEQIDNHIFANKFDNKDLCLFSNVDSDEFVIGIQITESEDYYINGMKLESFIEKCNNAKEVIEKLLGLESDLFLVTGSY